MLIKLVESLDVHQRPDDHRDSCAQYGAFAGLVKMIRLGDIHDGRAILTSRICSQFGMVGSILNGFGNCPLLKKFV